jgi:DNA polymerase III subunit gamma/tau
MSLAIKYRPSTTKELIGNNHIKQSIGSLIKNIDDMPRSILLYGESGCGKTTIARIIANAVGNCSIEELNSADFNGIDTIRQMNEDVLYLDFGKDYKVFIIDEAHRLSAQAQDAMLKTLEDGPKHCFFIICTTDAHKIKKAIKTRCLKYEVETLSPKQIKRQLEVISKKEGVEVDEEVMNTITTQASGSMREGITLFESVFKLKDKDNQLKVLKTTKKAEDNGKKLCYLLLSNKGTKIQEVINIAKQMEEDIETIRYNVLGYACKVIESRCSDRALVVCEAFSKEFKHKADLYLAIANSIMGA